MIFEQRKVILMDGTEAIFKTPEPEDAPKMLEYIKTACGETNFLARYPEEWENESDEKERAWVERIRTSPDTVDIACLVDGKIVGNCELNFRGSIKTAHRAIIAIAVIKDYWSRGIASIMFEEMIAAAISRKTEIMELEFVEGNERARHLYEKFGFRIVSERPKMFKLKDGTYLSEFYMQKYM